MCRLLFWSDVGSYPSIRRSTLTGRQVTYVITTSIRWPNGLTVDFDDDRIYWADAWLYVSPDWFIPSLKNRHSYFYLVIVSNVHHSTVQIVKSLSQLFIRLQ